jgi:hypothetical protein
MVVILFLLLLPVKSLLFLAAKILLIFNHPFATPLLTKQRAKNNLLAEVIWFSERYFRFTGLLVV